MENIWKKIEDWLRNNEINILNDLNKGGSTSDLNKLAKVLNINFSEDFKKSFLLHDGQKMDTSALLGSWYLLSNEEIQRQWNIMKKLWDKGVFAETNVLADSQVKSEWWQPKWIPITHNGAGDLHCLDFDPTSKGKYGQVILFEHMNESRKCIAPSFEDFLLQFANDLENGKYKIDNDGNIVRL